MMVKKKAFEQVKEKGDAEGEGELYVCSTRTASHFLSMVTCGLSAYCLRFRTDDERSQR